MADLKAGSTVGGNPIWHAGTFPLVPAGNSLTYRGKKVYTEIDKPQANDNDFVSKSRGGTYAKNHMGLN
ncbi:long-tail fiber protein [Klebsiella phage KP17]|nr:long-tail fiber protein [Klebsiella phage KP17]